MDPRLLISVLCGTERHGWLNPGLLRFIVDATRKTPWLFAVTLQQDVRPVECARNIAAKQAQDLGVEWLLMLDNDVEPPANTLELVDLARDEHDIIGLPYFVKAGNALFPALGTGDPPHWYDPEPGFHEVAYSGTGAIFIRRRVFEKMPRPYFRTILNADGTDVERGEDFDFCLRAREMGFRIWTHGDFPAEHFHQYRLRDLRDGMIANVDAILDADRMGQLKRIFADGNFYPDGR